MGVDARADKGDAKGDLSGESNEGRREKKRHGV